MHNNEFIYTRGNTYKVTPAIGAAQPVAAVPAIVQPSDVLGATRRERERQAESIGPTEVVWWDLTHPVKCDECGEIEKRMCDASYGRNVSYIYCYSCAPQSVIDCPNTIRVDEPVDHRRWEEII